MTKKQTKNKIYENKKNYSAARAGFVVQFLRFLGRNIRRLAADNPETGKSDLRCPPDRKRH